MVEQDFITRRLGPLLSSELGVTTWDWIRTALADPHARRTVDVLQRLPEARALELYSAPLRADGIYVGRLYLFRDVTREREAVRLQDQFVSTVSHELRTPLTAIQGFVEMILDGLDREALPRRPAHKPSSTPADLAKRNEAARGVPPVGIC